MGAIIQFPLKYANCEYLSHGRPIQMDVLTLEEIRADLSKLLDFESKVLKQVFAIDYRPPDPLETPIGNDMVVLYQYVYERTVSSRHVEDLDYTIRRVHGFLNRIDNAVEWEIVLEFTGSDDRAYQRLYELVETAWAYYNLEEEVDGITLRHASLLTGMNEASIRNAASAGAISLARYEDHPEITYVADGARDIAEWITSRKGYRQPPQLPKATGQEQVRVPFAADGSYFSPSCRMRGGYQIGKRGEKGPLRQRYVSDYWQALKALEAMAAVDTKGRTKAYWRRPSATSKTPGTVVARAWGSVDKSVIDSDLAKV